MQLGLENKKKATVGGRAWACIAVLVFAYEVLSLLYGAVDIGVECAGCGSSPMQCSNIPHEDEAGEKSES